jgi:hypothetical protein
MPSGRISAALAVMVAAGTATVAAQQPAPAPQTCPHGPADDEATMVSVVVAGSRIRLRQVIDSTLALLHYRVSANQSALDQWVTESKFGWPPGSDLAGKPGAPDPGVQVIVDLEPDTAGTMVHVAASAVCLVGTMAESRRPGSPEMALETVSAVRVASEIRRQMAEEAGNRTAGPP